MCRIRKDQNMKKTDRNVIMITAGGIGRRFGTKTPKQYMKINNKTILSYVIDACKKSEYADAILVVAEKKFHAEIKKLGVDVTTSGSELNITKRNGLDYIRKNSSCKKLVVVEAVRPKVTVDAIDKAFKYLDRYDATACARKITDSLGCYKKWKVNRDDYYTLNPPEGFRFALIDKYFKSTSELTESIQQLPKNSKIYLDFDSEYFDKITYYEDYSEFISKL